MNWILTFFKSSIGQKLIMSLTGLFLILFLIVHLGGNLQLLKDDGGEAFNIYAYYMTHNPLIKTVSYGLYFFIVLHAIQGIVLWRYNVQARGKQKYAVKSGSTTSWASRNMGMLGSLILIFIFIHMGDFWFAMKTDQLPMVSYESMDVKVADLYYKVNLSFQQLWIVIFYVIAMIGLAYHLSHGFESAFQSLGINHNKYTPIIKGVGKIYSIVVPLGFAIIPLYYYLFK
ncbi:MAG TPA: succinate dehydrogenase cytochrome b subunit [Saprospiraceae bacterium]|nr:succinate dehydrogenase cytochrome b subunit [Saprospiraceae bacterium]